MHRKERPIIPPPVITPKAEPTFVSTTLSDPVITTKEKPSPGMKGGKLDKIDKTDFVVQIGDLIEDNQTGEKFVTITVSNKILHYLFAGLGKYIEGFLGESESDKTERDNCYKVVAELDKVKDTLTGEINAQTLVGTQQPNATVDDKGKKE